MFIVFVTGMEFGRSSPEKASSPTNERPKLIIYFFLYNHNIYAMIYSILLVNELVVVSNEDLNIKVIGLLMERPM